VKSIADLRVLLFFIANAQSLIANELRVPLLSYIEAPSNDRILELYYPRCVAKRQNRNSPNLSVHYTINDFTVNAEMTKCREYEALFQAISFSRASQMKILILIIYSPLIPLFIKCFFFGA
jgi:hypothetical protein